ncbi:MAG: dihydrolipoyl dehydrogenase [Eubacteriales bacterium]
MIYDLIILGGGPAGYLAAERAGKAGLKVLVIEKDNMGGVCLNEGCIPTKTLLYSAKIADSAAHGEKYGVKANVLLDHAVVMKRKNKVVKKLTGGVRASMKALGVEIIKAFGIIKGQSADGYTVDANDTEYIAKRLLIATGSSPVVPPIPGVDTGLKSGAVLTSTEALALTEVPKSFVVIGGGVIGLEMAGYFNSAGATVTVIEMLDKIGGSIDDDIAKKLQSNLEKKGISFKLGCKVTKIDNGKVFFEANGEIDSVDGDKVLLSIGRRANTAGIGLENIGVVTEHGAIPTDEYQKTNVPEVYAAGDVDGQSMLAHTAYREAEVAVNNMLGEHDSMRYTAVPAVIYTNPEVAGVGMTEAMAKEKGMDVTVKTVNMNYSGRYMAENEGGDGVIKIVVDNQSNKLIGVHMIANYASEIIYGAGLMVEREMTVNEIKKIIFPHPTVGEIIREAIFQL